jgi:hypothetical protein
MEQSTKTLNTQVSQLSVLAVGGSFRAVPVGIPTLLFFWSLLLLIGSVRRRLAVLSSRSITLLYPIFIM